MLDYTIFGESHGPAVGVLVTGAAPGLPVDREIIARELQRRAPGGPLATARHETGSIFSAASIRASPPATPSAWFWKTGTPGPVTMRPCGISPGPAMRTMPPGCAAGGTTIPGAAGPIPAG